MTVKEKDCAAREMHGFDHALFAEGRSCGWRLEPWKTMVETRRRNIVAMYKAGPQLKYIAAYHGVRWSIKKSASLAARKKSIAMKMSVLDRLVNKIAGLW